MSESVHGAGGTGPSHRSAEIGVALIMATLAGIGIFGSMKVGIGWGAEGPQAGFFPFYVCLLVLISCAVNLARVFMAADDGEVFASWRQLRQVMAVVVPTAIYVALIPLIGIYEASALLIAVFMVWLGKYRWIVAIAVAILVPVLTYMMFEVWFLVPLPKGPIESLIY